MDKWSGNHRNDLLIQCWCFRNEKKQMVRLTYEEMTNILAQRNQQIFVTPLDVNES